MLLNDYRNECYQRAVNAGWYKQFDGVCMALDSKSAKFVRNLWEGTRMALIHSEVSEAMEGVRKDKQDEHLPAFKSVDIELADALIRIFDYAGHKGIDLDSAVRAKMAYNLIREDHKLENRAKVDGKQF